MVRVTPEIGRGPKNMRPALAGRQVSRRARPGRVRGELVESQLDHRPWGGRFTDPAPGGRKSVLSNTLPITTVVLMLLRIA